MRRNPLLTREYYQALWRFRKKHPGALEPVVGSPTEVRISAKKRKKQIKFKQGKTSAGRKDASAPVARRGESPARRSDEPGNRSGVGDGKPPGNSPSDGNGITNSRIPAAPPMCVGQDR